MGRAKVPSKAPGELLIGIFTHMTHIHLTDRRWVQSCLQLRSVRQFAGCVFLAVSEGWFVSK